ncbi:hypothetical protein EDB89DRAFT_2040667 [Lactarius sanguifluus]|nr:hypothetical protein EDB89DRAFT_2040667 [Lactarius sanguifluus]
MALSPRLLHYWTLPLSDLRMAEGSHSDMTSLMGTTWGATCFGCPECMWERTSLLPTHAHPNCNQSTRGRAAPCYASQLPW